VTTGQSFEQSFPVSLATPLRATGRNPFRTDGQVPTRHARRTLPNVEQAAGRLAKILIDEAADALTVCDSHGAYGHPDHIQVHRVGIRAAEIASTPFVFEATLNREHVIGLRDSQPEDQPAPPDIGDAIGLPAATITTTVDVVEFLDRKRSAMTTHRSQMSDDSFFLAMSTDQFRVAFGTEWYRQVPLNLPGRSRSTDLLNDDC
jgi:LmbE family N-acetylglucosaminyl deacetylase